MSKHLTGRARRRHLRLARKLSDGRFVRGEVSFRLVERLAEEGLLVAYVTKWVLFGRYCRPFRELFVLAPHLPQPTEYGKALPRKRAR